MADSQYSYMVQAILNYYSSGSDIWQKVNTGSATPAEIYNAFSYIPQVKLDKGIGGNILGVSYADPLSKLQVVQSEQDIIDSMNSNGLGGSYGGRGFNGNIPADFGYDSGTGQYYIKSGSSSLGQTLSTVADRASLAVTGVNIGCKLGKFIDQTLYDLAPDFWDENLPSINPATWNTLCGQSDVGDFFLRVLFDVKPEGTTGYISEEVLAYYYQMLRDVGALQTFESSNLRDPVVLDNTHTPFTRIADYSLTYTGPLYYIVTNHFEYHNPSYPARTYHLTFSSPVTIVVMMITGTANIVDYLSDAPFSFDYVSFMDSDGSVYNSGTRYSTSYTTTGFPTVQTYAETLNADTWSPNVQLSHHNNPSYSPITSPRWWANSELWYVIKYGDFNTSGGYEGITDIAGATQYPPTNITGTTTQQVLNELKQQYPDLFSDAITETTLQEDGTLDETTYVPVPWAVDDIRDDTPTTLEDATQDNTTVDPQTMEKILDDNTGPTTPDTGDGNGPTPVIPVGQASSLWAVYHPSQSQLNAFGAWLWSSDFVEQLKRLFNDPMQAIIGVHKVFAPIPTGGSSTIKCGYLDSGVSSPTVSSQYTEVNCGTVNCREYFGNVFDYDPHTKISIYLPFIGVVPLKVSEVMRASITVTYGVDVITGACLAKVKVMRDGGGAILYSYGGSCACHYPISSGSYAGIISGIVTSAIGIAGGIVTGNPLSAVGGAMAGLHQAHTDVQRSGGFTGCAGAMGPKIPYLIIDRPQTRIAADFEAYQGKPANSTQFIGDCSGFVRATEVHFSAPGAFDDEAKEIEALLKSGVLISD